MFPPAVARRLAAINSDMWGTMGVEKDQEEPMNTVKRLARMGSEKLDKYFQAVQTQKKCADAMAKAYR